MCQREIARAARHTVGNTLEAPKKLTCRLRLQLVEACSARPCPSGLRKQSRVDRDARRGGEQEGGAEQGRVLHHAIVGSART